MGALYKAAPVALGRNEAAHLPRFALFKSLKIFRKQALHDFGACRNSFRECDAGFSIDITDEYPADGGWAARIERFIGKRNTATANERSRADNVA